MPNTIITPEVIAREALMVLRNNAVMANLVHRDYSREFVSGVGNTITIRKPATFQAKEFNGSIEVQDINETGVPVKMDKHIDVSFAVTSEQMSLDIADFSAQLLVPAMQAFANKIDSYLIAAAQEATKNVTNDDGDIKDKVIELRKTLTENAAPLADRRFVYNSDIEARLLKTDMLVQADTVGDAGTALREASLGRKYGMDFYVDQNLDGTNVKGIAFHKNAFAFVTRPLALPQGASKSAIIDYDGFGLRVVYGYDIAKKTDTVSIDMICGVATLDENLTTHIAAGA